LGHVTRKIVSEMTCNVSSGTLLELFYMFCIERCPKWDFGGVGRNLV